MTPRHLVVLAAALSLAAGAARAEAQTRTAPDSALLAGLRWRSIGPANMAGRITDVEGLPSPSKTFYIAAAAGGIWKTVNNGTTFQQIFHDPRVISMGDLAIAPSDSLTIWAGSGEEDSRNSISPGGGIFKSTDGGKTWQMMGLKETQAIGRIVVHPTNKDIVWVAALGAPWNTNAERGLYKTTDGGRTWRNVKFISDRAGFVDIALHPRDPNTLFASSWERLRTPYSLESGGPGSALWKSTDGGETWTEVAGGGFPETTKGRIGVAISQSNPDVMYALLDALPREEGGKPLTGLYRSADGGRTWTFMNDRDVRPFYYSQVRIDPQDPDRVYWSSTPVNFSKDGGKTIGTATNGLHVDHHAMWIDPVDPNRLIVGNDGGIGVSFDRGGSYIFPNSLALGQFYEVSYNMEIPYRVCGGLQDNGSWCAPSRTASGEITNHHWATIHGGDGFFTAQDPTDPATVYAESQGGNVSRVDMRTGERVSLRKPNWRDRIRMYEDSILIAQPDTAGSPTPEVARRIQELRMRAARDSADADLRFNWNTPFFLSPHDPRTLYVAGSRLMKSTDRGNDLRIISPDLTRADTMKIRVSTTATGGVTPDLTGAETFGTIVAIAESPLRRGMLFAGTDDGNVWLSPDDGANWQDLTRRFPGLPDGTYVRRIEPSRHDANTFYVAFDGHRTGDYTPYVYVTSDGGRTFRSIAQGLPRGSADFVHVIREDPVNPDLLFVGTDLGVYASLDRGASWHRFMEGLPTTPVHDLQIHPRDRELIAGTHGRSVWIADIAPLQQLRGARLAEPTLFQPAPGLQFADAPVGGESTGNLWFEGWSPPAGAQITYYVPAGRGAAADTARGGRGGPQARIAILSPAGDTVQTLTGPARPGLHRVSWNLRHRAEKKELSPSERRDSTLIARRVRAVADSMVQAGSTTRETADRAVAMLLSGDPSALRRGGGGGEPGAFRERPAESYPSGGRESEASPADVARDISRGLRSFTRTLRSGYNPFGGWGGEQPKLAEPGEYTVLLTLGDRTLRQTLQVQRDPDVQASVQAAAGGR